MVELRGYELHKNSTKTEYIEAQSQEGEDQGNHRQKRGNPED
jgi:hypothetical protein